MSDPIDASHRIRPFFAAAEELGVLLFMHPRGFLGGNAARLLKLESSATHHE